MTDDKYHGPKHIYLSPDCGDQERTWSVNDEGPCEDCGEPWVRYTQAPFADVEAIVDTAKEVYSDGLETGLTIGAKWRESRDNKIEELVREAEHNSKGFEQGKLQMKEALREAARVAFAETVHNCPFYNEYTKLLSYFMEHLDLQLNKQGPSET